ncbi:MAG TPA: hypothetical protein VHG89_07105 [Verrucomicrobiae bacterium]|nr:hypothetical protein [Verrucomicrobiae bacterium]
MKLPFFAAIFLAAVFALVGCKRDEVKVYQIPNESTSLSTQNQTTPPAQNGNDQPQLQFILPNGWQQIAPSQMRVASFSITNAGGPAADVGVIPLPAGEDELALVNMWRDQMQLPALTNETAAETVAVGNNVAKLFEIASEAPLIDGKFRARILVAELTRGATSWFFKMTGEDSFVVLQKNNFLQFLKSVSFVENATPQNFSTQMASTPAAENQNANPNLNSIWTIPPDWKSVAPSSSILLAQFLIETNGAQAEVNAAEFPGDAGGLAANVNRWRGQLGLQPIAEILTSPLSSTDASGARVVDFTGTDSKTGKPARLVGAIVPQNSQTWFYKLMGNPQIVAQQKDAFLKFIQSAKYPDVR